MALPSSRAIHLNPCPGLRPRWQPQHSPWRIKVCCLPLAPKRRLSPTFAGLSNDHNYTFFGAQYTSWILVPSSFVRRLPGLHVDLTTELVANLYSGGTFAFRDHPLDNNNQFHPDLRGFPRFRAYLGARSVWFAIPPLNLNNADFGTKNSIIGSKRINIYKQTRIFLDT